MKFLFPVFPEGFVSALAPKVILRGELSNTLKRFVFPGFRIRLS